MYDHDWSSSGQKKVVAAYKLVIKDSAKERMIPSQ